MKTQITAERALELADLLTVPFKDNVDIMVSLHKEATDIAVELFNRRSWFGKWIQSEQMTGHSKLTREKIYSTTKCNMFFDKVDYILSFKESSKSEENYWKAFQASMNIEQMIEKLLACGKMGDPVTLDSKEAIFIERWIKDD